ncbi:MAG: hypothetical protein QXT01_04695 [Sulfolobales archaeon]
MSRNYVVLKDGYQLIMELFLPYRLRIYEYNSQIRNTGYYLKPVHVVVKKELNLKYLYFGRYWYRIAKGPNGKIKWIYVGKEKPDPNLPEPPLNPFEGLKIIASNDDIIVDEYVYKTLSTIINKKTT